MGNSGLLQSLTYINADLIHLVEEAFIFIYHNFSLYSNLNIY